MQCVDSLNERAGRGWGDINRGKWEEFKELYEVVDVLDV